MGENIFKKYCKEFFFLDNDTRLCKVAPEGWSEEPQKKTSWNTFTLFLRIKFFVSHCQLLQQSQTRHQFYLQLRQDILEENLYCNDETLLQLGVLALQAEFGSYPVEEVGVETWGLWVRLTGTRGSLELVVDSRIYFRVEDYIPASLIERMTVLQAQVQVSEMHRLSPVLWGEAAELEFLRELIHPELIDPCESALKIPMRKVTQQLPEYGVLVYRVLPEKTRPDGEMALGICTKGVIVYEMKNDSRIAILRFQWREIGKISTFQKKFTITSSVTGRKHMFITDSTKTCKYLLGLCSAQHHFNALMSSPQIVTDYDKCLRMANNLNFTQLAQSKPLNWMQKLSCTDNALFECRLEDTKGGLHNTSLDNFNVQINKETGAERMGGSPCTGQEQRQNISLIQKPKPCDHVSGLPVQSVHLGKCQTMALVSGLQKNRGKCFTSQLDQEIVHVTLSRDPCRGFGFVINEGEETDKVHPGIFISSIIPGGPAEKSEKIKPGGQILALNHISLEGFTFNMAVRMIQNSPDNIELIISQSKGVCGSTPSKEKNSIANSGVFFTDSRNNGHRGGISSSIQYQERNSEELELPGTQNMMPRLRPQLSSLLLKHGAASCPPSLSETNANEIYFVELAREDGTLGFSVTGGVNTSVLYGGIYVKSVVPGGPAAREGQIVQGEGWIHREILPSIVL
ncbi:FERM and PDZ domain-containing protein 2 [Erinaceus europaeus]|uniref:FERM and PDZ domain-containing protein 2 n=1 Tax=Erinaceus europaeus TaxID=9365 RepID=A0ABM3YA04_ERIEU|nr:FERM and PDZ domain-containing protein 2 [Erinaceus europaeus]